MADGLPVGRTVGSIDGSSIARCFFARSAFGAAWSLALGMVGVAGKRQSGNGPAPI